MRRVALFLTVLFAVNLVNLPANSAAKAGAKCTKQGATSISSGKKYTCVKSGKTFVWNKGVAIPKPVISVTPAPTNTPTPTPTATPTPTNIQFKNPCEVDPLTPPQWKEMENFYIYIKACQGIYRINKKELPNAKPNSQITSKSVFSSVENCKIRNIGQNSRNQAFPNDWQMQWWKRSAFPAPKMTIQVIPFYGTDTPFKSTKPMDDYGKYFNYFKEWVEYTSDVTSSVEIRVPDKYFDFGGPIGPYGVTHEKHHTENEPFSRELIKLVDPFIDFKGVNMTLVVAPPGTPYEIFFQGSLGEIQTNEGSTGRIGALPPETFTTVSNFRHRSLIQPNWMIHEFFHVGIGLDDRYGNSNFFNNPSGGNLSDSGLGGLTLMSTSRSDLSAWEKWIMGFIDDSQVRCFDNLHDTTSWITPSTTKSNGEKLLVIKLSSTKVIAIESMRDGGLNYKLNSKSFGAFVYLIDTTLSEHGRGMQALYPDMRFPEYVGNLRIFYEDAPFKVGDQLIVEGIKISVIEAGEFGDVVKVEKI